MQVVEMWITIKESNRVGVCKYLLVLPDLSWVGPEQLLSCAHPTLLAVAVLLQHHHLSDPPTVVAKMMRSLCIFGRPQPCPAHLGRGGGGSWEVKWDLLTKL